MIKLDWYDDENGYLSLERSQKSIQDNQYILRNKKSSINECRINERTINTKNSIKPYVVYISSINKLGLNRSSIHENSININISSQIE